ncbi:MAG: hypothetical protein V1900_00665 [Candidatus Aenigmatarchaeota archaeon]
MQNKTKAMIGVTGLLLTSLFSSIGCITVNSNNTTPAAIQQPSAEDSKTQKKDDATVRRDERYSNAFSEAQGRRAIETGVQNAMRGFNGRYELKPRDADCPDVPDFSLRLYDRNGRHITTLYYNIVTDNEPVLTPKGPRELQMIARDYRNPSNVETGVYDFTRGFVSNMRASTPQPRTLRNPRIY